MWGCKLKLNTHCKKSKQVPCCRLWVRADGVVHNQVDPQTGCRCRHPGQQVLMAWGFQPIYWPASSSSSCRDVNLDKWVNKDYLSRVVYIVVDLVVDPVGPRLGSGQKTPIQPKRRLVTWMHLFIFSNWITIVRSKFFCDPSQRKRNRLSSKRFQDCGINVQVAQ